MCLEHRVPLALAEIIAIREHLFGDGIVRIDGHARHRQDLSRLDSKTRSRGFLALGILIVV